MPTFFTSLVLLFIANSCLAMLQCQAPFTHLDHPIPPISSDCRQALAHMPLLDQDLREGSSNPLRLLSPSSPFLPQAQYCHESCVITIGYLEDSMQNSLTESLTLFPALPEQDRQDISLHEESVYLIWTLLRDTAERIVDQCVDHMKAGVAWAPLHIVPPLPYAWYIVKIVATEQLSFGSYALRAGQRVALQSGGTRPRIPTGMTNRVNDKFRTTFLDV